jgi:hypothetical protein
MTTTSVLSKSIWTTKKNAVFAKHMNKTIATNQGMDTPGMKRRNPAVENLRNKVSVGHGKRKEHVSKETNVHFRDPIPKRTNPTEAVEDVPRAEAKAKDDPLPKTEEAIVSAKALTGDPDKAQIGQHHLAVATPPNRTAVGNQNPPVDDHNRQGGNPAASHQGGAAAALTVVDHKRKQSHMCL